MSERQPKGRRPVRIWRPLEVLRRFFIDRPESKYLYLLATLVILLVVPPLLDSPLLQSLQWILMILVLIAVIPSVSEDRRLYRAAWLLVIVPVLSTLVREFTTLDRLTLPAMLTLLVVFFVLSVIAILMDLFRARKVTIDTILGAVCAYLLVGLIWALLYRLSLIVEPLALRFPGESTYDGPREVELFAELSYFSFVTLSTLGYGDIAPVSPLARVLAYMEAVAGQTYLAILVARLVALQVSHANLDTAEHSEPDVTRGDPSDKET